MLEKQQIKQLVGESVDLGHPSKALRVLLENFESNEAYKVMESHNILTREAATDFVKTELHSTIDSGDYNNMLDPVISLIYCLQKVEDVLQGKLIAIDYKPDSGDFDLREVLSGMELMPVIEDLFKKLK